MSSFLTPTPGSGGGTLSVQAPSDLTGVNVGGAAIADLVDGQLVHTAEPDAYWRYHNAQDAAPSPGTVVNNPNGGQFLRDLTYHGLLDVQESAWYVDGAGGNDDANGKTLGTAIKTWAELQRRIGNPDVVAPPSSPFVIEVFVSSPPPDVLQGDFFAPAGTEVRIINTAAIAPPPGFGLSSVVPPAPASNVRPVIGDPNLPLVADAVLYDYDLDCWIVSVADAGLPNVIPAQPYYRSTAGTPFVLVPFTAIVAGQRVLPATLMPINVGDIDGHQALTLEGFDLQGSATITRTRLVACKIAQTQIATLCRTLACLINGATVEDALDAGGCRFGHSATIRGKLECSGLMGFVSLSWYGESDLDGFSGGGQFKSAISVAAGLGEDDTITIPAGWNLRMTGNNALFGSIADGTGRAVATLSLRQAASCIGQLAQSCTIPDAGSVSLYLSASVAPAPVLAANTVYDPADLAVAVPPASLSVRDRFGDNTVPGSELNKFPGRWISPTTSAFVHVEVPNP